MSEEDKFEIVRDNRVTRLLWFAFGVLFAIIINVIF